MSGPFFNKTTKPPPKGYEVAYLTDVIDEYVMSHLTEYDDKKLANAQKEDAQVRAPAAAALWNFCFRACTPADARAHSPPEIS
jgi:hypothetical protein